MSTVVATRKSTQRGVPGIPHAALAAVQDENVRQVLQALVDGWGVRNGNSGTGNARFVTVEELGDLRIKTEGLESAVGAMAQQQRQSSGAHLTPGEINRVIGDLEAQIIGSLLWKELGERIELIKVDARTNAAGLSQEYLNRLNADNAIVQSTTTQFATVNGNIGALQTQYTTTANNVAALSQALTTLQSVVGANTVAIQTEATTRADTDNDIYAKYSVKIDVNGYVTGYGLMSTANNGTPTSSFIIRADRFAIGSPSGPGITPAVPFIVLTTTDSKGNPPGVYMRDAMIANAAIGTLMLGGNVVTVPAFSSGSTTSGNGSEQAVASVTIDVGTEPCTVFAMSNGYISYGSGWRTVATRLEIGTPMASATVSSGGGDQAWMIAAHSGAITDCVGNVTATLYFTSPTGAAINAPSVFIMAVKR